MNKRLFAGLMAGALLLGGAASADVDLSGMSYEELVALKDRINMAIWESEEWQEVTVPQGVYEVGVDIPAGHWTVKPLDGGYSFVHWGDCLDEYGTGFASGHAKDYVSVVSPSYHGYDEGEDRAEFDIIAVPGTFLIIDHGDAVFVPYAGKPSLGFK